MARVITVTSGKGGVGKTNISVNLALQIAHQGYRVCVFDADLGLANINILLKLQPAHTLEDVILHDQKMRDILLRDIHGIDIIPGSSGVEMMADLDQSRIELLAKSLAEMDDYDFLIFDTSAGVSRNVVSFCMASSEVVLVATPEPTSLTDAYALLKILTLNGFTHSVRVVVNQSKSSQIAKAAFGKLKAAVQKFLDIDVLPLGTILHDPLVEEAVKAQTPFILRYPNCAASKCIKNIANNLIHKEAGRMETVGLETFWTRCLEVFKTPLMLSGVKPFKKAAGSGPGRAEMKGQKPDRTATEKDSAAEVAQVNPGILNVAADSAPSVAMPSELGALLASFTESFKALSRELGAIRQILEEQRDVQLSASAAGRDLKPARPDKISFDFQTFLKRRQQAQTGADER